MGTEDVIIKPVILSVVVPVYNEEAVVEICYKRTSAALSSIEAKHEIIFIDDGSSDSTVSKVRSLHQLDSRVKLICLSRNFGKEIAVSAGLDFASGEAVIVLDADLQDPPELIPEMVAKWREGYDTVYGKRANREGESHLKKLTAKVFYRVMAQMSHINIPEDTGDFRLLSRRTIEALKLVREQHRFMKGLFSWVGFRQTGLVYNREPRIAGRTKWNYFKLFNFAVEGITSFSHVPIRIASYCGLFTSILALLYAVFLILRTLIFGRDVAGYASLMVAILFFSGLQLLFLGVLGEYLGRTFDEAKRRPLYLIQDIVGLSTNELVFLSEKGFHGERDRLPLSQENRW
ncbi:MAG: glycosyltransferase family 2 protein [Syntrophobacteraceae bacterium]|nr:glycosyltransferase family 2 protein [Syntrophobacteraceae bacterium]